MAEQASISTGIADRYATAVFELTEEAGDLAPLDSDVAVLNEAISSSDDFRRLISSPVYTRDEMQFAVSAVAAKIGLSATMSNVLALMAQKRRLFVLPQLLTALTERLADARGEVPAEVVSTKPLTKAQVAKLSATLKAKLGKNITLNVAVDESLIGGLIVKVGSKMIDTSVRSKLAALQSSMKEVG